jgi:flavin reductase (DIM6/NTAB) family NADH-FMN oxidoreductase RutF
LAQVYGLLEPGPVVLVTTARAGRMNVMPMSWHTMMEFLPPLVGCVVSNQNYTFEILRTTGECVINVPTVELAKKVVRCGNTSGRSVDKFKTIGLTPVAASVVKAPLIVECYANLECKVVDRKLVTQYNFFVLEVVKAWIRAGSGHKQSIIREKACFLCRAGGSCCRPQKLPSSQHVTIDFHQFALGAGE